LASGLLPTKQDQWLYFEDTSLSLSETLTEKLSAILERE
jgi:hypothetical protein